MKILVVGTGVIGTIYGWALAESGNNVTHLVRCGRSKRLPSSAKLDVLDERKDCKKTNTTSYQWSLTETPTGMYDVVIIPTGAHTVLDAIKSVKNLSDTFLLMSANWSGLEKINQILDPTSYILGYADGGGALKDDLYWTNLGSEIHLGCPTGGSSEKLEQLKNLFLNAHMKPDIQKNMLHWLYLHNAISLGYWAAFAKHCSIKPFLNDRRLLKQAFLSTQEIIKLCGLRGVDLKTDTQIKPFRMPEMLFTPLLKLIWTFNKSVQRYIAHGETISSEPQFLLSQILDTADKKGFEMPETRSLSKHLLGKVQSI